MIKNNLIILGLLKEREMHGYQIINEIKNRHIDAWADVSVASIYKTLEQLSNDKMITKTKERVGKMPERNVYKVTKYGENLLKSLIKSGIETVSKKNPVSFLLSCAFINNLSKQEATDCLNIRKQKLVKIYTKLNEVYNQFEGQIPFNWLFVIIEFKTRIELSLKNLEMILEDVSNDEIATTGKSVSQ